MGGYGPAVAANIIDRANEIHAENKQKRDEEHARKISDLVLERTDLVNKLPTLKQGTPEYQEAYKALQGVNADIIDVYHPQRNPGAIEKFGHLLTDSLKITNPQERAKGQEAKQQQRTATATKETDRQIAAAPPNAEQAAIQQAQAKSAAALAGYQADLKSAQTLNPNMTPEEKSALESELKQKYFGETGKGNWQSVAGTIDGTPTNLLFNKSTHQYLTQGGSPLPPEIAEKFVPTQKETTASENIAGYKKAVENGYTGSFPQYMAEQRRLGAPLSSMKYYNDYALSHGFKSWDEIPAEYRHIVDDYAIRKQALDKAYPVSSTVTSKALDAEGQFRTITVTNYKTPQGTETLQDPLWFLAPVVPGPNDGVKGNSRNQPSSQSVSSPAAQNAGIPLNPKTLKKEAETRNPNKNYRKTNSNESAYAAGNVKISEPLFPGQNKEYNDARKTYDAALLRQHQMHTFLNDALKTGNQQAQLGLLFNHIGMTQGAQPGSRMNQASIHEAEQSTKWVDSVLSRVAHQNENGEWIYDGPKNGVNLTKEQMEQMVELADEGVVAFKENVDRIHDRLFKGTAIQPKSGTTNAPQQSKGTVSIAKAKLKPQNKGKTDAEIKADIEAHHYTAVP